MNTRNLIRLVAVLAAGLVCGGAAFAQAPKTARWEDAQRLDAVGYKLYVVTIAEPTKRHVCTVESINADEIVCKHSGHARAYRAADIAALIRRGEHTPVYLFFAGFLAAGGAATWGTVVLAPICPVCAVATGVAALFFYVLTTGSGFLADGDYDGSLMYLAPGQTLQVRVN